ncbi:MAG TPA: DUF5118 domain-containing protein, partial [Pyrinomonadaceae bacterium]|nr:DUF5118 domain-containing protein [Pyrinomonadaceae bacterium]
MRVRPRSLPLSLFVLSLVISVFLLAPGTGATSAPQDPPPTPPTGGGAGGGGQERPGGFGRQDQSPEPRPYDRVITKEAKSDAGVFTVHTIKDKVYYEIPKSELNREFLWVSQIAKTTLGAGYGGQAAGNRVVKWERKGNRILLRNVAFDVIADQKAPIARAVQA